MTRLNAVLRVSIDLSCDLDENICEKSEYSIASKKKESNPAVVVREHAINRILEGEAEQQREIRKLRKMIVELSTRDNLW
jgi:uncharacterized protein YdiU (UPF0061 family)